MITSRTPYRVSFAGGGTDLPAWYNKEGGAVVSTTINQYVYCSVHPRFEDTTRVSYSQVEVANHYSDIKHDLVREALHVVGIDEPLDISTVGDVPGGTGLGSSSAMTVGLLEALYKYKGKFMPAYRLAEQACKIEIEILGQPIGKQDQYACAMGGLNYFRFNPGGEVDSESITLARGFGQELEQHSLMIYLGKTRSSATILQEQTKKIADNSGIFRGMRHLATEARDALYARDLIGFAKIINAGWSLKQSLGCGIGGQEIEAFRDAAKYSGAMGSKLLGAGGCGFLYVVAPPDRHSSILEHLEYFGSPKTIPFKMTDRGSEII